MRPSEMHNADKYEQARRVRSPLPFGRGSPAWTIRLDDSIFDCRASFSVKARHQCRCHLTVSSFSFVASVAGTRSSTVVPGSLSSTSAAPRD